MRFSLHRIVLVVSLTAGLTSLQSRPRVQNGPNIAVPRIWDDMALADWATPVAGLNVRPAHYTSAEYYGVSADNLKTYPVYHPDSEPPGYWQELQEMKPAPLVDISRIRATPDWIAAGALALREMDSFWSRTADPADIA